VITDCRISSNENAGYYSSGGAGMLLTGGSPKVTGCTISNNKAKTEGAGIALGSSNAIIKNCLISGNELSETDAIGAGIFIEGNSTPTISNSSIIDNKNTGYNGGGIYVAKYNQYYIATLYVVNSTFAGNDAADGVSFYFEITSNAATTITNSILWNDVAANEIKGWPTVSYSDVKQNSEPFRGIANINVDPLFVDPANGNYHLQIGSPCIDTGTATGAPDDDIDGDSRPQQGKMGFQSDDGQEFDRGSDEYVWVGCTQNADCEDDNPCTDDSCVAGNCVNANNDTNSCSDGNPCNEGDYCSAGECISGTPMDCNSVERCSFNYEECGDGVDNDCDGRIDEDDEYCGACFSDYYPTEQSFDHNGGTGEFNIYIGETCYRDARISIEDSSWIEIPEDNWDRGDVTIPYTVSANTLYTSRTGWIQVYNHATQETKYFTITQSGKPCDIAVPGDFHNIQDAIDASIATGCTITVGDGTYNENIKVFRKSINIKSVNGPGSTIIDGGGDGMGVAFWYIGSSDSVLDGFTIRHATQGLYFYQTTAQATNCIVTENTATNGGAGVYCYEASPTITNTIISSNTNSGFLGGGGVLCNTNSSPTLKNCTVRGNETTQSSSGGGINSRANSSPVISHSVISGNTATQSGGGLNVFDATSSLSLTNCVIASNTSSFSGGGFYCSGGSLEIVNCTISENSAVYGGGIYNNASAKVTVTNSILWGDTAENPTFPGMNPGNEVYPTIYNPDLFNITYSDVDQNVDGQGSEYPGTGNIRSNPLFAGSLNGDYHLTSTSPCIDAGTDDTTTYPNLPTDDLDGNSRPWDGDKDSIAERDMGAYELVSETKPTTTGGETTSFIDGELSITFDTVTSAGETTVTVLPGDPANPPQGFQVLGRYYDISTTATFTGMLEVCFHYDPEGMTEEQELALQILHYEEVDGEDKWIDITTSRDVGEHIICGRTSKLSLFVLVTKDLNINIDLNSGWNLISLNVDPSNTAIGEVLAAVSASCNSVWAFANGWKAYYPAFPEYSDLDNMETGWGYWLNMNTAATLVVSGSVSSNPISLVEGWNLVGYNSATALPITNAIESIATYCESVWVYKEGGWKAYYPAFPEYTDLYMMEPHYGYWIKTTDACLWTLP
jgi:parallel beta-helix repeat protein